MARVPSKVVCAVIAAVAGVATLAFVRRPELRFAYESATLRVFIETAAAMIAIVVAYIFGGRYRRSHRADHLGVAVGLLVLAVGSLITVANVAVGPWNFVARLAWGASVTGIAALAVAAFVSGSWTVRSPWHAATTVAVALGAMVALAAAIHASLGPPGSVPSVLDVDPGRPLMVTEPVVLIVNLVAAVGLTVAAFGFARSADRRAGDDSLLAWLAAGTTIGAFGRLHNLLFAPVRADWVYTGTVLRLLFYLVLLVGAAGELERYWRGLAEAAVLDERRRIARDLHDGVAQELALITRIAFRLHDQMGPVGEEARRLSSAAARGLTGSRRAVAALAHPLDAAFPASLQRAVADVADHLGVEVTFDLPRQANVGATGQEALVRIACEAVTNAAIHGHAKVVHVGLRGGRGVTLRVTDDGVGFEPVDAESGVSGFGIRGMRERAEVLGGTLRIETGPGHGTAVEVVLA